MSKLNIQPSPNPQEKLPAFIKGETDAAEKRKRAKRNWEIVDEAVLLEAYPHLFKYTPDYTRIGYAVKAGILLPGIQFNGDPMEDEHA